MKFPFDVTFHPSWWHKYAGTDFSQPFFDEPAYRIESDIKMRRCLYDCFGEYGLGEKEPKARPLIGTDYLAAGYLHSEIMGCKIVYQSNNSPQVKCMNFDIDSMDELLAPDISSSPVWARTQKQIDWLLEKYGRVETYINLMGIQNIALDLLGQDVFVSYYSNPEDIDNLLQRITDVSIAIGKKFSALSNDISGGVTAIVRKTRPECYLTSNCSVEMVSNDIYEQFLLKFDQQLADAFGSFGVHHCGQTMEHVCPGYNKIKGLTFAEVGAGSDLASVRLLLPNIHLNARYSSVNLKNDTESMIYDNVNSLYAAGKGAAGLFSISCVGIDSDTPESCIVAFLKACAQQGQG